MLQVEDIHVYYGNIHALKGASFEVAAGEIVTLVGANGAGKSTTLRALAGLNPTSAGTIRYDGAALGSMPTEQRVNAGLILCPEGRQIFANLTVEENLRIGAFLRRDRPGIERDIARMFDFFPRLRERARQRGGTLSGGEQQMLAISRALMSRPRLLMLDEPSLGLAPLIVKHIFEIIVQINQEDGMTVLLVEQNAHLALKLAHRAYVIETGTITMSGPARELLHDPRVREAYLGL